MYYKITNKESQIYKELYEMRIKELQLEADNLKAVKDKIGSEWTGYIGHFGQQNFNRTTTYYGFNFCNPNDVDLKTWKLYKDSSCYYVPNKRSKKGKEISEFLNNLPVNGWFDIVLDKLNIKADLSEFRFPYVEVCDDIILIYLDDDHIPENENIIEITSK